MAQDRIAWVRVSSIVLPLATPISDAKVLTGRQKPMTEVVMLFAEVQTADGQTVKARDLSGGSNLLFRRNSVTGAVEVVKRDGTGITLNEALHAN